MTSTTKDGDILAGAEVFGDDEAGTRPGADRLGGCAPAESSYPGLARATGREKQVTEKTFLKTSSPADCD